MKPSAMRLPSGGVLDLDENVARAVLAHLELMAAAGGGRQGRAAERRRDASLARLDARQLGLLSVVGSALQRLAAQRTG